MQGLIFVGVLVLWECLVRFHVVSELALAPPSEIFPIMVTRYELFLTHLAVTIEEICWGFVLAIVLSFILSAIVTHSKLLANVLYPYIIGLNSTAKVALAPLFLLLFGYGIRPIVAIVVLISFLPLTINMITGFRNTDRDLLDLMQTYGANKWQIFFKIRLPSSLPYVFSGLKISAVLAVKGAVIGEVFQSSDRGLGFLITQGDFYFDIALVYAAVIITCSVSIALYLIIVLFERKVLYWL